MSLQDILKELNGVNLLSEEEPISAFVDSGSYALNKIISGRFDGGYPIGNITEIYGESSTAKTVFITHAFRGAQAKGFYTVMVDNEHSYSAEFAKILGVDPEKVIYAEPETIETCFAFIEEVIKKIREHDKDTPILIGFDSIGTTPCNKELSDELKDGDHVIIGALRAKITGQWLRRINPLLKKNKAGLIIINQIRSKIGVMFGDPRTKAGGGKSLDYYCSVSLETVSNKGNDVIYDENKKAVGIEGTIRNKKNKVTIPYQECEFRLLFDKGLDRNVGLCDLLIREGLVYQPGKGWYAFTGSEDKSRKDRIDSLAADKISDGTLLLKV